MKQQTLGLLIITLLMSFGIFVGIFVGPFISQSSVPASHKAIIDHMTITASAIPLAPAYLSTGKSMWQLSVLTENFLKYKTYQYTLWVYSYQNDPEVYVCIWGPGKDGKTYQVELSASYARDFTVTYGSLTQDFELNAIIAVQVGY
jgi:uncharacterized protein YneF (UPF0154 family)